MAKFEYANNEYQRIVYGQFCSRQITVFKMYPKVGGGAPSIGKAAPWEVRGVVALRMLLSHSNWYFQLVSKTRI